MSKNAQAEAYLPPAGGCYLCSHLRLRSGTKPGDLVQNLTK